METPEEKKHSKILQYEKLLEDKNYQIISVLKVKQHLIFEMVCVVKDKFDDSIYVAKCLRKEHQMPEEFRTVIRLQKTTLVPTIHDILSEENSWILISEMMKSTWASKILKTRSLEDKDIEKFKRVMEVIIDNGVLPRDPNPTNVLFDDNDDMVLTDFDSVYISNKRPDESVHRKLNAMIDRYLSDLKYELKRKSIHFSDDNEGSSWYQVIMRNDWYNIFKE